MMPSRFVVLPVSLTLKVSLLQCTKICREFVPRIKTSANFSPGTGAQGNAFQWIRIFRESAFVSPATVCHHVSVITLV
eukprot:COSAG04_NODE_340_length_16315_cov_1278.534410_3_plen_78_part_00